MHGSGAKLWHWGAPTPRWCIERMLRTRSMPIERLLSTAIADATDLRARFAADGFVRLEGAFPVDLARTLRAKALEAPEGAGGAAYFRIGVAHEAAGLRDGKSLRSLSRDDEVEFEGSGDPVIESPPGRETGHAEFGRQLFHTARHTLAGPAAGAIEEVGDRGQVGAIDPSSEGRVVEFGQ